MGRIGTAFRAFFVALFSGPRAEAIREALDGAALPKITDGAKRQPTGPAAGTRTTIDEPPPKRSEAITLLATLQREARLLDLIQEPLENYTDEQIGAAARGVLKDSAGVIARLFTLQPVRGEDEGAAVEVPSGYDPTRYRLTGRAEGAGPFRGKLAHKGWQATSLHLPTWTGSKEASLIIAPAEIEV
jgi:hypothetical protein